MDYDGVLMERGKVLKLGMKVTAGRKLRWLDRHKGAEVLSIEKKYLTGIWDIRDQLKAAQIANCRFSVCATRAGPDEVQPVYRCRNADAQIPGADGTLRRVGACLLRRGDVCQFGEEWFDHERIEPAGGAA